MRREAEIGQLQPFGFALKRPFKRPLRSNNGPSHSQLARDEYAFFDAQARLAQLPCGICRLHLRRALARADG